MDTLTAHRTSITVVVRCTRCGDIETISDRQLRRKQRTGRPHLCSLCKEIRVKPPTEQHFNYWLNRYTIEEIKEMAQAIWG